MAELKKEPFYREDDDELIGYIVHDTTSWQAQTFFGYTLARTITREEAAAILRNQGLGYLMGAWQYFDADEKTWFPCVIQEAYPHKVIVIRTNEFGIQDPDTYKRIILQHPTEDNLIKAS